MESAIEKMVVIQQANVNLRLFFDKEITETA